MQNAECRMLNARGDGGEADRIRHISQPARHQLDATLPFILGRLPLDNQPAAPGVRHPTCGIGPAPFAIRHSPFAIRHSAFCIHRSEPLLAAYLGLPAVGFGLPRMSPSARCALTAPFHLCRSFLRLYVFCATFPRVAPGWRYQPPCPVRFGLSSLSRRFPPAKARSPSPALRLDYNPAASAVEAVCIRRAQT